MKRKLLFVIFALVLCIGLFSCGETYDSLAEDQATVESPADPTQKVTIEDYAGVFSVQLDSTYVGSKATDFLTSIGEDASNFSGENIIQEGYKLVVQEYTVSADQGYEDEPFSYANVVGNDMWDTNHKSKYNYSVFDLYENAGLDYYQLELSNGENSKMYFVFEIPNEVEKFVSSITGLNRDFWFVYDVSQ